MFWEVALRPHDKRKYLSPKDTALGEAQVRRKGNPGMRTGPGVTWARRKTPAFGIKRVHLIFRCRTLAYARQRLQTCRPYKRSPQSRDQFSAGRSREILESECSFGG